MKNLNFRIYGLFVFLTALFLVLPGCKWQAPVLNDLSVKAASSRTITLAQPVLTKAGYPAASVYAFIGPSGQISVDGSDVSGSTEGPVDVSKGTYQFKGLNPGTSYDIIVVAKNISGCSVKSLVGVTPHIPQIDLASYQSIGTDEMGLFRWYLTLADDPISDLSKIPSYDDKQTEGSSYRYSLAFMTYFLILEQYHKIPACAEIIRPRIDRLIQKMLDRQVWTYWANTSQGVELLEPKMNRPYPEQHDPVADQNIMYSGHLGMMIASYEMLYRDMKWSEPGSIVFKWSDTEEYVYDNYTLQKVMYDQMANNSYHGIECEPNAVFPECNQHPIISFMLYDHVHGTSMAEARNLFLDFFLRRMMIHPLTHEVCVNYLVKQNIVVSQENPNFGNLASIYTIPEVLAGKLILHAAAADGWTGTFMHAWQPDFIERHYPYQKKIHVLEPDSMTAHLDGKKEQATNQLATPFFAMLAAEVGDTDTRDKLIAWCKDFYKPVWENGMLHYPAKEPVNVNTSGEFTPNGNATTGSLIAFAMANSKYGMWSLVNRPFTDSDFNAPKVTGVDFPNVLLKRAIYDFEKEALVITTSGGALQTGSTSFNVTQLDPARSWKLFVDGVSKGEYTGVSSVSVTVSIETQHDITLIAE
jgi:hypothetical protein